MVMGGFSLFRFRLSFDPGVISCRFFPHAHEVYNYVITSVALAGVTTPSPAPYSSTRAPSPFVLLVYLPSWEKTWPGGRRVSMVQGWALGWNFTKPEASKVKASSSKSMNLYLDQPKKRPVNTSSCFQLVTTPRDLRPLTPGFAFHVFQMVNLLPNMGVHCT